MTLHLEKKPYTHREAQLTTPLEFDKGETITIDLPENSYTSKLQVTALTDTQRTELRTHLQTLLEHPDPSAEKAIYDLEYKAMQEIVVMSDYGTEKLFPLFMYLAMYNMAKELNFLIDIDTTRSNFYRNIGETYAFDFFAILPPTTFDMLFRCHLSNPLSAEKLDATTSYNQIEDNDPKSLDIIHLHKKIFQHAYGFETTEAECLHQTILCSFSSKLYSKLYTYCINKLSTNHCHHIDQHKIDEICDHINTLVHNELLNLMRQANSLDLSLLSNQFSTSFDTLKQELCSFLLPHELETEPGRHFQVKNKRQSSLQNQISNIEEEEEKQLQQALTDSIDTFHNYQLMRAFNDSSLLDPLDEDTLFKLAIEESLRDQEILGNKRPGRLSQAGSSRLFDETPHNTGERRRNGKEKIKPPYL